jgi:glycosyltransferase involved in cell wall biosynthesis
MKLLISGYFVETGCVGGAEHMFYNLISGLSSCDVDLVLAYADKDKLSKEFQEKIDKLERFEALQKSYWGPRFFSEQLFFNQNLGKLDATIFPNYFTPLILPQSLGKVVTVIHDVQYRHLPQYFSQKKKVWLRASHRLTIERADSVICISKSVQDDLISIYGEKIKHKLEVVHNPISWDRFELTSFTHPFNDTPYFLSVAAQYPHKNLETLVRAFSEFSKINKEFKLILVGQLTSNLVGNSAMHVDILEIINELRIEDRVIVTGYVNDEELGKLYQYAHAFLFPSVFEGFGMPPVEALGLGVPTVTTTATSLPEVTLGLCSYVEDGKDICEWESVMTDLVRNYSKFKVSDIVKETIREHYCPLLIASQYLDVCSK